MVFTFTETCNLIIMKMLHTVFYFEVSPLKIVEGRKERKKRTTTTTTKQVECSMYNILIDNEYKKMEVHVMYMWEDLNNKVP